MVIGGKFNDNGEPFKMSPSAFILDQVRRPNLSRLQDSIPVQNVMEALSQSPLEEAEIS